MVHPPRLGVHADGGGDERRRQEATALVERQQRLGGVPDMRIMIITTSFKFAPQIKWFFVQVKQEMCRCDVYDRHCLLIKYRVEYDRGAALSPQVVDLSLARRYEGKGRGVLSTDELVNSQSPKEEADKLRFLRVALNVGTLLEFQANIHSTVYPV